MTVLAGRIHTEALRYLYVLSTARGAEALTNIALLVLVVTFVLAAVRLGTLIMPDGPTGTPGRSTLGLRRGRPLTVFLVGHGALAGSGAHATLGFPYGEAVWEARGTVTIMFSDIVGFTSMIESLGETRAREILHGHCAIVREQVAAYGGVEVKALGDGFMIAFADPRPALHCAVAIQRATASYDGQADAPLRLRIGLHTGEATKERDDFFGRSVILAARIAATARGGEVLVSSAIRELAAHPEDFIFDGGREVALKGLNGTHRLYAVGWEAGMSGCGLSARGNGERPACVARQADERPRPLGRLATALPSAG